MEFISHEASSRYTPNRSTTPPKRKNGYTLSAKDERLIGKIRSANRILSSNSPVSLHSATISGND